MKVQYTLLEALVSDVDMELNDPHENSVAYLAMVFSETLDRYGIDPCLKIREKPYHFETFSGELPAGHTFSGVYIGPGKKSPYVFNFQIRVNPGVKPFPEQISDQSHTIRDLPDGSKILTFATALREKS